MESEPEPESEVVGSTGHGKGNREAYYRNWDKLAAEADAEDEADAVTEKAESDATLGLVRAQRAPLAPPASRPPHPSTLPSRKAPRPHRLRVRARQDSDAPVSAAQKEDLKKRAALKEAKKGWDNVEATKEAQHVVVSGESDQPKRVLDFEGIGKKRVISLRDNKDCTYELPSSLDAHQMIKLAIDSAFVRCRDPHTHTHTHTHTLPSAHPPLGPATRPQSAHRAPSLTGVCLGAAEVASGV